MNQVMINAVELDSLLKEVEYLKHENQKLKEQLKDVPKIAYGCSKKRLDLPRGVTQNYEQRSNN
jgi:hypothetical protein